ncbi:hypothetical protein K435DRAFT_801859 [Dendrothele bispora CBS 962.96]|uniref:Uncharacterized protein n=1 Tax=Dendrothele bispora (strain CBS 962.96) TaxID=1314807 RepID=A0A4S8LNF8_DENBC|nr:hypothetical protein K435DRAFT_801859 [Dendrothele bispora CBS 962.96]
MNERQSNENKNDPEAQNVSENPCPTPDTSNRDNNLSEMRSHEYRVGIVSWSGSDSQQTRLCPGRGARQPTCFLAAATASGGVSNLGSMHQQKAKDLTRCNLPMRNFVHLQRKFQNGISSQTSQDYFTNEEYKSLEDLERLSTDNKITYIQQEKDKRHVKVKGI